MATNNDGHLLDSASQVAVDFVWGNMPMQPNDDRAEGSRLDPALDNHIIALSGWNGYPQYSPNTTGEDVAGSTDYVLVPSVLGLTTTLAQDAMKDASLTVTTASAATNTAKTVTAAARASGSTLLVFTASGAGAAYGVGTKVTVSGFTGGDAVLNATYTVVDNATNTFTVATTATTTVSLSGQSASVVGVTGTIKTQSLSAGQNSVVPGTAVTITPWA